MKKILLILSLLLLPFTLSASHNDTSKSKGITQDVIEQLSPTPEQEDVSRYVEISASFSIPLDLKHVKKNDIKLTHICDHKKHNTKCKKNKHVKGIITYIEDENKVTFTPTETLSSGLYEVTFKSLKADKAHKKTKIKEIKYRFVVIEELPDTIAPKITLNGETQVIVFQGANYVELGATVNDDRDSNVSVSISGNVDSNTLGSYTITYTATDSAGNSVTVVAPTLISLSLESNVTTLNMGEKVELILRGTYSDGSSKELDVNIEYIITPIDSAELNGTVLTARKDGDVMVQAKVDNILSNTLKLSITWTVNGHTLPPAPDKIVNDSTLLGIDINSNGVRDDVERWIYEEYDHPIERGIFMQSARAYNLVIVDPSKAHDTLKYMDNAYSCRKYWLRTNQELHDKYDYVYPTKKLSKKQFNTLNRHIAYERYNSEFSGEVFGSPKASKDKCEFDESGTVKAFK